MYFQILIGLVLSVNFELLAGQVVGDGQCPTVKVMENFHLESYLGKWFEYARYPVIFETDAKCVTGEYIADADQGVRVHNKMINEKTGEWREIIGFAKPVETAKLAISFPINKLYNVTGSYWVLDTDYKNYSVVYSCKTIPTNITATTAWILTRAAAPSAEVVEAAEAAFRSNNISLEALHKTDQVNCD